jgi:hypothetical protein
MKSACQGRIRMTFLPADVHDYVGALGDRFPSNLLATAP